MKNLLPHKIILASNSPRRKELLAGLDVQFEVRVLKGIDDEVLGKPKDAADARRMLRELSGQTHQVITGVVLTTKERQEHFSVVSNVTFKELTDDEIDYYVETYKPMDKAGAYGIQEWIGYVGVTRLEGSYFNVMGLPVQRIYEALRRFAN